MLNRNKSITKLLKLARIERTGTLDLSNRCITITDVPEICEFLIDNPNIQHVNLSSNYLGPESAQLLAQLPSLLSLDISNNLICNAGAAALVTIPNLKILNIANNLLTDAAIPGLYGHFYSKIKITLKMKRSEAIHRNNQQQNTFTYDAIGNLIGSANLIGSVMPNNSLNANLADESITKNYDAFGNLVSVAYESMDRSYSGINTNNSIEGKMVMFNADHSYEQQIASIELQALKQPESNAMQGLLNFKLENTINAYQNTTNGAPQQLTCENYFTKESPRLENDLIHFKNYATENGKKVSSLLNCTLMFFNRNPHEDRDNIPDELHGYLMDQPFNLKS